MFSWLQTSNLPGISVYSSTVMVGFGDPLVKAALGPSFLFTLRPLPDNRRLTNVNKRNSAPFQSFSIFVATWPVFVHPRSD
jgi:hypothetical protein